MYELHLHLLLLVGMYLRLLKMLQAVPFSLSVMDISRSLTDARTHIMKAIADGQSSPSPQRFGEEWYSMKVEDAVKAVVECGTSKGFSTAIELLHDMRYREFSFPVHELMTISIL